MQQYGRRALFHAYFFIQVAQGCFIRMIVSLCICHFLGKGFPSYILPVSLGCNSTSLAFQLASTNMVSGGLTGGFCKKTDHLHHHASLQGNSRVQNKFTYLMLHTVGTKTLPTGKNLINPLLKRAPSFLKLPERIASIIWATFCYIRGSNW